MTATARATEDVKNCRYYTQIAAGIDIGASELFVAVAANRDPQPVRSFPTFTRDLHSLADWLQECRKTDVSDCQWIQYLHSVGLLRASFRPPGVICAIRSLWRHRSSLIQMAAEHVLHMQKALDQMNLQIHRVLSDITGISGLKIMDAILADERDPLTLARQGSAITRG